MSSDRPAAEGGDDLNQFDWVMLTRLSSRDPVPHDIHATLGLEDVRDAAAWCYRVRRLGHHVEPDGSPIAPQERWLRASLGLAGSIAESLAVCAGCEVEMEMLRRSGQVHDEIAIRFFSIASSQEIIGIGHRLMNLTVRAVSARPDWRALLLASPDRAVQAFAANDDHRSGERRVWLSLNSHAVRAVRDALQPVHHSSIRTALAELSDLVSSDEWTVLEEVRGETFHRARPESSVASGVDAWSGLVSLIRNEQGRPIGTSFGGRTRYGGGDGRQDQEAAATADALRRMSVAARAVTAALVEAIEPLTRGTRSVTRDSDGTLRMRRTIGGRWDDAACSCCTESTELP